MYSYLYRAIAIPDIADLLTQNEHRLPKDFFIKDVMGALRLVMEYNVFQFGDCIFLQEDGTAMGTPAAVEIAAFLYGNHEEKRLFIQKYAESLGLYRRQTDNIIGTWTQREGGPTFS